MHALTHGAIPPEHVLRDAAQHVGFGPHAEVETLRSITATTRYLWIDARKRVKPKPGEDEPKPKKWRTIDTSHRLWINGGRLQHSTHGYWRVDGERVAGWKEAARLSGRARPTATL